ncbi:type II secretion system protein [Candidatus Daviesbacteria bacterium]|nr:type II secretion system protein [Candidatus Daviesbacteria bacterium]
MPKGFTLVEILVVVTIIGVLSATTFVKLGPVTSVQIINKALTETQSLIRTAQSNATTSTICDTRSALSWSVYFDSTDQTKIYLKCNDRTTPIKTLALEKAKIESIAGNGNSCFSQGATTSYPTSNVTIKFYTLYSKMEFLGDDCIAESTRLTVTLKTDNTSVEKTTDFTIDQGGGINVN